MADAVGVSSWKTVRVFVSSTFRDMHAERDHLVKVCFPRLRQWCEERRLHFTDIDLRWGITREEAEDGKAIEICLTEVDGCRPFFVCLLGEQYGSLAPTDAQTTDDTAEPGPYSLTHLEIAYAALDASGPVEPYFYLRDPSALLLPDSLNIDVVARDAYTDTYFQAPPTQDEPDLRKRLVELKRRIRDRFGPEGRVREYSARWEPSSRNPATPDVPGQLVDLEVFGNMVEADLKSAIELRFGEHLEFAREPLEPVQQEQELQNAFIASRVQMHAPDERLQRAMDDYVASEGGAGCCVTGPAGSGKSAALSFFVSRRMQLDDSEGNAGLLVFRAAGASPACGSLSDILASIWFELNVRIGGTTLPLPPRDPADVLRGWEALLSTAAAAVSGSLVIVIDGLDQLHAAHAARGAFWVPRSLPRNVRLLLGAASDPAGGLSRTGWVEQLRKRDVIFLNVAPLDEARIRSIVKALPSLYAKSLDERQTAALLANQATTNPLFLTVALRELRLFGSFQRLDEAVSGLPHPREDETSDGPLKRLFNAVLARLEADQPPLLRPIIATLLGALVLSRNGLAEADLNRLLAQVHPQIPRTTREWTMQVVLRQLRPYLQRRRADYGVLLGFFHRSLSESVIARHLQDAVVRTNGFEQLATLYEGAPWFDDEGRPNLAKATELPRLRLLIAQERPGKASQLALAALLHDWDTLDAKYRAGLVFELAGDLREAQSLLAEVSPERKRLALIEEALRRDIEFVDTHRSNYPQALFQCLWNSCWWHDHPSTRLHFQGNPNDFNTEAGLAKWIEECRAKAALREPGARWLRQLRPSMLRLGAGLHRRFTGFSRAVTHIVWSPDGRLLYAVSARPALRVFDVESGEEVLQLASVGREVKSITVSPDGERIAFGLAGSVTHETIKEYSATGEHLATHNGHRSSVQGVRYSADAEHLIAASGDGSITVWSVGDKALLHRNGTALTDSQATFLAVNFDLIPGSTHIAICRRNNQVTVWDWLANREVLQIPAPIRFVDNVKVSPCGDMVASHSGYAGEIGLWIFDFRGRVISRMDTSNELGGRMGWSPDGKTIAIENRRKHRVRLFRIEDGACVGEFSTHLSKINALSFSPDGSLLATAAGDALAGKGLSAENEFEVHVRWPQSIGDTPPLVDHEHEVSAITYTPEGDKLISMSKMPTLVYRNESRPLRLWDAASMLPVGARLVRESLETFQLARNGALAVTYGRDNGYDEPDATAIRIWQWPQMTSVWAKRFAGWVTVSFPPSNKSLWLRHGNKAGTIGILELDLKNGSTLRQGDDFPQSFSPDGTVFTGHACFSADVHRLASIDRFSVVVRDWPSGQELHRLNGHAYEIKSLNFSTDGSILVSADRTQIRIWDSTTGECLQTLDGSGDTTALLDEPNAQRVWPLAADGELRLIQGTGDQTIAYAPGAWRLLCSHPSDLRIAGVRLRHLSAWELTTLDAPGASPSPPSVDLCEAQPPPMSWPRAALWTRLKRWFRVQHSSERNSRN